MSSKLDTMAEGGDQSTAEALRVALADLDRERSRANRLHDRMERDRHMVREVRTQRRAIRQRNMTMMQTTMRRRAATVDLFRRISSQSIDESEDEGEAISSRGSRRSDRSLPPISCLHAT